MFAADGKMRLIDAADVEQLFTMDKKIGLMALNPESVVENLEDAASIYPHDKYKDYSRYKSYK